MVVMNVLAVLGNMDIVQKWEQQGKNLSIVVVVRFQAKATVVVDALLVMVVVAGKAYHFSAKKNHLHLHVSLKGMVTVVVGGVCCLCFGQHHVVSSQTNEGETGAVSFLPH
jgi:hypothetical protein